MSLTDSQTEAVRHVRIRTNAGVCDALAALQDHRWSVDGAIAYLRRVIRNG